LAEGLKEVTTMWNPKPELIMKMYQDILIRHEGNISSAYLDWEVLELIHPGYDKKIQQPVPLMVVDFMF
jgi:hypothetical protein